jgi:hypothetical protein
MHNRPGDRHKKLHRGADGSLPLTASPTLTASATLPVDEQVRAVA